MSDSTNVPNGPSTSGSASPPVAPARSNEMGDLASEYIAAAGSLTDALRTACERTSVRRVAKWSGLSVGLLGNILTGKRKFLSPELAERVATLDSSLPMRPDEQAESDQWQRCDICGMEVRKDKLHTIESQTRSISMHICARCVRNLNES